MENFLRIFIFGLSHGLILFLLATGMTLTMGLMRVVNMSHGAVYMAAGYLGVWVIRYTGYWLAGVLAGAAFGAAFGLLLEMGFLRRLYKSPPYQVLLTIGFIHIITNLSAWIFGNFPLSPPIPGVFSDGFPIGNVTIPYFRLFIIGFGVVMAVILWLLQDKTRIGASVRAGMDNREVASTLGMNLKVIFTGVFVLGSLIAGMVSVIGGSITGLNSQTAWDVLLLSIIVVILGGTGSIQGALLGGIIIGLVNAFGAVYFQAFSAFTIYAVLITILLIKPSGLLGRELDINRAVEEMSSAGAPKRLFPRDKEESLLGTNMEWKLKLYRATPYALAILVLTALPNFLRTYQQSMMSRVLIFALFAMSLDIVMGFTGMRSFGHAAFFGTGGYTVGLFAVHLGITSFWLALPITLIICALMSAAIGYFTLKLRGVHFLLITMAFGQLLFAIANTSGLYHITGGTDGLVGFSRPRLGFDVAWTQLSNYYFVLIIFLICYFLIHRFMRSSYGKTLVGVRENEGRMRALGFDTWKIKYVGVILAGVFAGIAGLLYAYTYRIMVPADLALTTSALPMLMLIMGGGATLWGPALGAMVIVLAQTYASMYFPERWPLILGAIFVLCVLFLSGGFARYLIKFWDWVGSRLFLRETPDRR